MADEAGGGVEGGEGGDVDAAVPVEERVAAAAAAKHVHARGGLDEEEEKEEEKHRGRLPGQLDNNTFFSSPCSSSSFSSKVMFWRLGTRGSRQMEKRVVDTSSKRRRRPQAVTWTVLLLTSFSSIWHLLLLIRTASDRDAAFRVIKQGHPSNSSSSNFFRKSPRFPSSHASNDLVQVVLSKLFVGVVW